MDYLCGMQDIEISETFSRVLDFVNHTNQPVFLTGKAGTGKTTLLKYIRENSFKQMAVCAPTGVAAINAGGSTLHSFLQLPFGPFLPELSDNGVADYRRTQLPVQKFSAQRLSLLRNLELLVIDEISMVRADLLDLADGVLRQARRKWHLPFGGVQVLMIGDMHQLPPVVKPEEWQLLRKVYRSPYFFESLAVRAAPPVYIELEKIYRQKDQAFIDILNKVRSGTADEACLSVLNNRYRTRAELPQDAVTLTTHNRKADEINQQNLNRVKSPSFVFRCTVKENFPEKSYPADPDLELKKGARVMFLRNNPERNYYNGKCGVVTFLAKDKVTVVCDEDRDEITVPRETWDNISYRLNPETRKLEEEVNGSFTQYPLRLAWAITIHKSQGLTFDKLVVDAAESFSSGQVYVALSRCRSLEGLTLSSRVTPATLFSNDHVKNFSASRQSENAILGIYDSARREFAASLLKGLFDFSEARESLKDISGAFSAHSAKITTGDTTWLLTLSGAVDEVQGIAARFQEQLAALMNSAADESAIAERTGKAATYFIGRIDMICGMMEKIPVTTESSVAASEINHLLNTLNDGLFIKRGLMRACHAGFNLQQFVKQRLKAEVPLKRISISSGARNRPVPGSVNDRVLYEKLLLLRDEICEALEWPIVRVASAKMVEAVCNSLPRSLPELFRLPGWGKAKVNLFGERFLKVVSDHSPETQPGDANTDTGSVSRSGAKVKGSSKAASLELFRKGLQPREIAAQRGMSVGTIESHLALCLTDGNITLDELIDEDKKNSIVKALDNRRPEHTMSDVKSALPEPVSWGDLRYVIAHLKHSGVFDSGKVA
jgi:hypothetical protein